MPIHHSIDSDRQLSVTTITGTITVSEAVEYIKKRANDDSGGHLPVLVDASKAEQHDFLITDMDLLARVAAEIHQRRENRKEAFVAENEHNIGLLTIFRKFSVNGDNQRVFQDIEDAVGWLQSDPAKA